MELQLQLFQRRITESGSLFQCVQASRQIGRVLTCLETRRLDSPSQQTERADASTYIYFTLQAATAAMCNSGNRPEAGPSTREDGPPSRRWASEASFETSAKSISALVLTCDF
ncbi:hypothetical protein E4U54_002758 [Claviceps lovelessii]|nr:hypothetical protein E4U54_002758 [Claviceps lovelessii]